MVGAVLDSEEPSDHYISVNGDGYKAQSPNRLNDSMFHKTGPTPSQASMIADKDLKAKQVANMKHAVNSFIGNMINNEMLYQRFKKMEEDDEDDIKDLVREEFKLFEIKEARAAKMSVPQTRMTMATRMETSPTMNDREITGYEQEVDDILSSKVHDRNLTTSNLTDTRDEDEILKEVDFSKRKQEMIRKIADTLYKTEFPYLEYLNHMTTECSESTRIDTGCPLEKCKWKNPMSINDLRLHLVNECNKIIMVCNVCDDTMRRPWVPHHNCIRTYRARLSDRDLKIDQLYAVIDVKDKMIEEVN